MLAGKTAKTVATVIISMALGSLFTYFALQPKQSDSDIVFSNEQLEISYKQVNSELFDLVVTPKNGMNLSPEYSLNSKYNYADAYLVGMTEEKAKQLYSKRENTDYPFTWNQ